MAPRFAHFADHDWPSMDAKANCQLHPFLGFKTRVQVSRDGLDNAQTGV